MCGITAYVGANQAAPILLNGLEKLEYRGYDSAGIAIVDDGVIEVKKTRGRLQNLKDKTKDGSNTPGCVGIGHTRWATHGEPSDANAHPHLSNDGKFAVVHNGIIENYQEIKAFLEEHGHHFLSQTDTEVISHLLSHYDKGDLVDAVLKTVHRLQGSYAIGILSTAAPEQLIVCRKDSPLVVGKGEGENFAASDIPALLRYTRDVYYMEDDEIAILKKDGISFYNIDGEGIEKELSHIAWDIDAAEKGGYEHFMMKEMMEQPDALRRTIQPHLKEGKVHFDDLTLDTDFLQNLRRICIIGCGSSYHVGMLGKSLIEARNRIVVDVDIASEFRYRNPILDPDSDLCIVISQSGETADTLAAMREAKRLGVQTLAIVNVVGSSIAREADAVIYTWAGPEIAVATTKAFTTQLAIVSLFSLYLSQVKQQMSPEEIARGCEDLEGLPTHAAALLEAKEALQKRAAKLFNQRDIFFIGRGLDYALSLEGSLKLKEISYIHSEATPAGELKHGPISLIEDGTLVIALMTQEGLHEKMASNIEEVRARGAHVFCLCLERWKERMREHAEDLFYLPEAASWVQPILSILPLQLFAYYVAILKGCDVDKPRNLAKSVTVE